MEPDCRRGERDKDHAKDLDQLEPMLVVIVVVVLMFFVRGP
jgi:hypothetical protein